MAQELKLAARIDAKPGKEEELSELLSGLVSGTRSEPGCLRYDLYRDPNNPGTWIFVENWASHDLWKEHVEGPRFIDFKKRIEGVAKDAKHSPYKLDPTVS